MHPSPLLTLPSPCRLSPRPITPVERPRSLLPGSGFIPVNPSRQIKPPRIPARPPFAYLAVSPAFPISEIREPRPGFPCHQASIKAKTPVIVLNQGISRHPQNNTRPLGRLVLGASLALGGWPMALPRARPFALPRLCAFALKPRQSRLIVPDQGTIKPQSRQKTQQSCIIKPHQGKRRFFHFAPFTALVPLPLLWMLGVRCWWLDVPQHPHSHRAGENSVFFPGQVWSSVVT